MTLFDDTYDDLFQRMVVKFFPALLAAFGPHAWLYIKAQAWQESKFDPGAVSEAGAVGLMQLMPGTDMFIDGDIDGADPEGNVANGVQYMAEQWDKLSEIPSFTDRLKAAQASYNGGRGYINAALSAGRIQEGFPGGFSKWVAAGRPAGMWQTWPVIAEWLKSPFAMCNGLEPDWRQMLDYVEKIEGFSVQLIRSGGE